MMTVISILKSILHFLIVIVRLLVFLLFILVFGLPTYSCRYVISKLAPACCSDLGKMLTTHSSLFGVDDITGKPKSSGFVFGVGKGEPSFDQILKYADEAIRAKDPLTNQYLFPELQQYVCPRFGFLFWKWDKKFDIANHIRYYFKRDIGNPNLPDHQVSEEEIHDIIAMMTYSPFTPERSPWEVLYFPDVKLTETIGSSLDDDNERGGMEDQRHSAFVLHAHHSLGDALAVFKFLNHDVHDNIKLTTKTPNYNPALPKMGACKKLFLLLKAPYDVISERIKASDPLSDWHLTEEQLERKINSAVSSPLPMSHIKEIKNAYHVAFVSVVISAFTGALRKFMIEAGHVKVPESIHCLHPLPMPSHPDKLRTRVTACFINLPVGIADPKMRLLTIDSNLLKMKENTLYPLAMYYFVMLAGGLWSFMIKRVTTGRTNYTSNMSNFPGYNNEFSLKGFTCKSAYLTFGVAANVGIVLSSMSYNGFIRIVAAIDEAIVPSDTLPATRFIDYFMEELDSLKREAI